MSSTAETLAPPARRRRRYAHYGPHRFRMAFRRWRRSRPFWGGFLTVLAGSIITLGPPSAYKVMLQAGDVIWEGILVGALITVLGLFLWYQPAMRHFFGVLIVILSLVSFITSDIGGFLIGMTLAMTGGSMGFAWVPVDPAAIKPHLWRRQARHDWKQRRRLERMSRRQALEVEEEAIFGEVPGVAVERPGVETPGIEVPATEVPRRTAEPVSAAPTAEPGAIETTGEEVERLPKVEAGVESQPPPGRPRRRFPFRNTGR